MESVGDDSSESVNFNANNDLQEDLIKSDTFENYKSSVPVEVQNLSLTIYICCHKYIYLFLFLNTVVPIKNHILNLKKGSLYQTQLGPGLNSFFPGQTLLWPNESA